MTTNQNLIINWLLKLLVVVVFAWIASPQSTYYDRAKMVTKACTEHVSGGSYISHRTGGVLYHKTFGTTFFGELRHQYKSGDSIYIVYDPENPDFLYPRDFPDVRSLFIKSDILRGGVCLVFIIILLRGLNKDPYPWHIRQKLKKWYESW